MLLYALSTIALNILQCTVYFQTEGLWSDNLEKTTRIPLHVVREDKPETQLCCICHFCSVGRKREAQCFQFVVTVALCVGFILLLLQNMESLRNVISQLYSASLV